MPDHMLMSGSIGKLIIVMSKEKIFKSIYLIIDLYHIDSISFSVVLIFAIFDSLATFPNFLCLSFSPIKYFFIPVWYEWISAENILLTAAMFLTKKP